MSKTGIQLAVSAMALLASSPLFAKWNEVDLGDIQSHQIFIGSEVVRIDNTVLFWSKGRYVLDDDIELSELEYGSWLVRSFASCDTNAYRVVFSGLYSDSNAKILIRQNMKPTEAKVAESGTINDLAIQAACAEDEGIKPDEIGEIMVVKAEPIELEKPTLRALGDCFANEKQEIY